MCIIFANVICRECKMVLTVSLYNGTKTLPFSLLLLDVLLLHCLLISITHKLGAFFKEIFV